MSEVQVTESVDADVSDPVPVGTVEPQADGEDKLPGAVLKRTREARSYSIADVVQVIRFSARQIEALERDDYASLPGSIAVRGLVRNYAKFLRIDPAPLLAKLEPAVPVREAEVRPPANMGEAEQPTIVERVPPSLVAAGAFLLILALAAYWYVSVQGAGGFAYLFGGPEDSVAVAQNKPLVAPAREVVPAAVVPSEGQLPVIVSESAPSSGSAASSTGVFPGLHVEFDDFSWIEVRDANQKVVFVGEYPAGTTKDIEGEAPFQIWIGKASGVRVFMGERSIDLKPHTREEVARFTLK